MTAIAVAQLGLKTIKGDPTYEDAEVEGFEWKKPSTTYCVRRYFSESKARRFQS